MEQHLVEKGGTPAATEDNFRQNAPQLSLPKGGGAVHGMGEKFSANPVTGTGSMSIPIATSPAAVVSAAGAAVTSQPSNVKPGNVPVMVGAMISLTIIT